MLFNKFTVAIIYNYINLRLKLPDKFDKFADFSIAERRSVLIAF